jgi:PAS domain S-box-containing protein
MSKIRILILEDNPADAELMERELRRGDIAHVSTKVSTKEDFEREITENTPELILSDYSLPQFNAMEALLMLECKGLAYIPFIIVTGTIKEEIAIACVKSGVWDYVIKDHIMRLSTAVNAAMTRRNAEKQRDMVLRRLERLNGVLLGLGEDHIENINRLVALAGEITEASCAIYNRLEGDFLCSIGEWNTPPGYSSRDKAEGHICRDVIEGGMDEVVVIKDLLNSKYAKTDPNVPRYGLKTYMGKAVRVKGKNVGSMCVVYTEDVDPGEQDERFLSIIASAVAVEEDRDISARALAAEDTELTAILDAAPVLISYKDAKNRFVRVNKTFSDTMGLSVEYVHGKTAFDLFPEEADEYWVDDKEVISSGKPKLGIVEKIRTKEGKKWFQTDKIPNRDEKGNVIGVVGFSRDIDEHTKIDDERQRQAELAYRTSDALFRIGKIHFDTIDIFLSKAAEMSAETILTDRVSVWFFSEDQAEILCAMAYDRGSGSNTRGERLRREKYPVYFAAFEKERIIDARDARNDPRTSEFSDDYFIPNGIVSTMDVPIRRMGRVIGMICYEQTGDESSLRTWDHIERDFVVSISEMVVAALEIQERAKAEEELKKKLVELNQYKDITVGRENRMIELKKEVNKLSRELGQPEPYDVSFAE